MLALLATRTSRSSLVTTLPPEFAGAATTGLIRITHNLPVDAKDRRQTSSAIDQLRRPGGEPAGGSAVGVVDRREGPFALSRYTPCAVRAARRRLDLGGGLRRRRRTGETVRRVHHHGTHHRPRPASARSRRPRTLLPIDRVGEARDQPDLHVSAAWSSSFGPLAMNLLVHVLRSSRSRRSAWSSSLSSASVQW